MSKVSKAVKAILDAYFGSLKTSVYCLEDDFVINIPDSHREKKLLFELNALKNEKAKSKIKTYTKNAPTTNKTKNEIFKQF